MFLFFSLRTLVWPAQSQGQTGSYGYMRECVMLLLISLLRVTKEFLERLINVLQITFLDVKCFIYTKYSVFTLNVRLSKAFAFAVGEAST